MKFIGGTVEAVELLTGLENSGNLVRLNSQDWLAKINAPVSFSSNSITDREDLLLIHLNFLNKSDADKFVNIYPPLSFPIRSMRCVFLVLNLTLRRVLCIGIDGSDVFVYDSLEGKSHNTLQDVAEIDIFLQSDRLNQVQKLVDGLSEYVQSLGEYKSLFRFSEDEVYAVLENTDGQSDSSVVEIEGMSLTRGELIEYDKIISANALRMNVATRKVDFFFPDFDFSLLNPDEYL